MFKRLGVLLPVLIAVAAGEAATPAGQQGAEGYEGPAPAGVTMPGGFLPAFPGAEGYGATTPGGRGGELYVVTNLNDAGPGSFRDAISKPRRTIVFGVSGTIQLKRTIQIEEPYITVAGQTAPGDGICLRGYTLQIQTHDVVVRHLRVRLGDETKQQNDAIGLLNGCRNIILDHCSATWSVDEGLSTSGEDKDITVQWCLIGNALNASLHSKGSHGYGSLARANGPVSWYHNLWAHNHSRNPRLGDAYNKGSHPFFDVRYNVIYNPGEVASGLTQGVFNVNYVGNYVKFGPDTKAKFVFDVGPPAQIRFHLAGNVLEGNAAATVDNRLFLDPADFKEDQKLATVEKAFASPVTRPYTAQEAYEAVLSSVGAVLPTRDAVDAAIVETVRTGTGKIINSQKDVGGWPELKSAAAPADGDRDGMPDAWERAHKLAADDPKDAKVDSDKDGYTNLEEYLNGTRPDEYIDYRDPRNNVDVLVAKLKGNR